MRKWEYHVVVIKDFAELNQLGQKGWELVLASRDEDTNVTALVFKRPIG
jgi:hypothetical protein